jgi:hypothetical protein
MALGAPQWTLALSSPQLVRSVRNAIRQRVEHLARSWFRIRSLDKGHDDASVLVTPTKPAIRANAALGVRDASKESTAAPPQAASQWRCRQQLAVNVEAP